ncbi:MAG TPA: dihydrodipicolinate synthase family protein [Candidatus Limnocylindria bacterium]|jgi:dihydrodipicolinate synthase/N-acetylneuraminate lyase|nr:dihydrodipicolinate synthase family protein [Candidatus Limnocylindria bacterium]
MPHRFRDQHLKGVWAAIPLPWTDRGTLDAGILRELIAIYKDAGVHGVYTTGTDGEFHVLELSDFRSMVDAFARAVTDVGIPAQVGVTWVHTAGVIERTAYARDRGIQAVQVALPFWQALNDRELTNFFADLARAFPDVALIHYNIALAKRFLTGTEYRALLEVAPNLVGTKQTGGNVAALEEVVLATPELHHFVVDPHIVPGLLLGAKGTYSAAVNISAVWMMEWWADCERGDWSAATSKKVLLDRMDREAVRRLPHLSAEPSWSKLYTRCGIFPTMPLAVRAPYLAATEDDARVFRGLLETEFAEMIPTGRRATARRR